MEFLENAIKQIDTDKKNVLEFRDPSWFQEEVYDYLRDNNVGFCTVSAPDLPDDLITTSSFVYVRFHGNGDMENRYRYLYSEAELEEWASKITESAENSNVNEIFCYFNNDYEANAVFNCEQLREMLN